MVSIDAMDNFGQKEMKLKLIKNTLYDWFINYISKPTRKSVGGFKNKIVSLLRQTNLNKLCMGEERN